MTGGLAPGVDELDDDAADEVSRVIAALCALEHIDWLAAVSALVRGGPGTPASAAAMARYVREYCEAEPQTGPKAVLTEVPEVPDEPDDPDWPGDFADFGGSVGEDFDEEAVAELFSHVASLWELLGATDAEQRLTSLGWWGLPEAMRKVWDPSS